MSRPLAALTIAVLALVAAGWVAAFPVGDRLLDTAFDGTMPRGLGHLVDPERHDRRFYEDTRRAIFPGLVAGVVAAWALAAAWIVSPAVRRVPRDYFRETDSPVNLAVFRIVLFGFLLVTVRPGAIAAYGDLPRDLLQAPVGLGPLMDLVPLDPPALRVATWTWLALCLAAMLGIFSRTSAALATLLGVYVLAVPHLWGKVSHGSHHMIWFGALLATSRCGDALSIDRLLARRRDAPPPPARDVAYALPLRFTWLLMGVIYLFPGLWKLFFGGIGWLSGRNLVSILHYRWCDIGDWTPPFRIDRYPILLLLGAVSVVVFEVGFIVIVLFRRWRRPLAATGVLFHLGNRLLMQISFASLVACYVTFVDWSRLLPTRTGDAAPAAPPAPHLPRPRATIALGVALLAGNSILGLAGITQAWPLSCYPRYFYAKPDHQDHIVITARTAAGDLVPISTRPLIEQLGSATWSLHRRRFLRADEATRHRRLRAMWDLLAARGVVPPDAVAVRVESERRPIDPEQRVAGGPWPRRLLADLPLD